MFGKGLDYWWEEWIKPIIIAAILALFIRTFIIQPFKIPSTSMVPTLQIGDRIFVSKFIYGAKVPFTNFAFPAVRKPEIGDIVVFKSTEEKNKYLVKRYIAGPGDKLEIRDANIYINGEKVTKKPISGFQYLNRGDWGTDGKVIDVPENSFYVLGDNSPNSMDSRYWGFVPVKNLVGKAFLIYWPLSRMQLLENGKK